ncbi:MAG TPA: DUF5658 family protein [Defluviitaleaceae bacterium]|nr:hypothetical protein [Candidatus Epulonipiscium sp.]HOQ16242.1 DUF5658 family protein [Defluviitaleaceae bacterium]HPT75301.1 DUF5658 family protein [Defluviitaleaceae bacterium]HQD50857.1 DUF5658 family protein [Defluviitaleaceae bacterium]
MSEFSKEIFINYTKKYFYFIAVFNFIDMILTLYATTNGYGVEINPFLARLLHNPPLFIIIKGILPSLLLFLVFNRLKKGSLMEIKKSIFYLKLCSYWYMVVIASHFVWIYYSLVF